MTKMTFLQSKTQLLMLKGRFDKSKGQKIIMHDSVIKFADSVRYLGVTIDPEMGFDLHVKDIVHRTKKTFLSYPTLSRANNGYSCMSLRVLYKGLIQLIITYASELWGAVALRKKTLRRALLGAQRQALPKDSKAYKTVSADTLRGCAPCDDAAFFPRTIVGLHLHFWSTLLPGLGPVKDLGMEGS